jgi:hypothetical protein
MEVDACIILRFDLPYPYIIEDFDINGKSIILSSTTAFNQLCRGSGYTKLSLKLCMIHLGMGSIRLLYGPACPLTENHEKSDKKHMASYD